MADELSYEEALALLDERLRSLEEGDLTLEAALTAVEEARKYLKVCQERLVQAKRKIEVRPVSEEPGPPEQPSVPELGEADELFAP